MLYLATNWETFNNNDDVSFDKDIPDADGKKVIQRHFKLKKICMEDMWAMCGECEEKETFDVMINVRPCTMTRQGHSVSWDSCKICPWEEKLSVCQD